MNGANAIETTFFTAYVKPTQISTRGREEIDEL
jgi:hypothetical protein